MSSINKIRVDGVDYDLQGYGDVLPIGTELEIGSNVTIPDGWVEIEYDTGWVNLTVDDNVIEWRTVTAGGIKPEDYYKPQVRKVGNTVFCKGQIRWEAENANLVFTTLPEKYRPSYEIRFKQGLWVGISGEMKVTGYNQIYSPPANEDKTLLDWVTLDESWVVGTATTKKIKKIAQTTPYEDDTGWIDLTLDENIVQWRARLEDDTPIDYYKPKIRRIGKNVYMRGQVQWSSSHGNMEVFTTIPEQFRPSYEIRLIQGLWLGQHGTLCTINEMSNDWVSLAISWCVD